MVMAGCWPGVRGVRASRAAAECTSESAMPNIHRARVVGSWIFELVELICVCGGFIPKRPSAILRRGEGGLIALLAVGWRQVREAGE